MSPRSALAPDRYPQPDFFVCDIFDAVPKSDMASMMHPIFSVSTKPDHTLRRYENGPNYVEIRPGYKGLATVHDRDVLIFCISQIMAALNKGRRVSKTVRFKAIDLIVATNRQRGGEAYRRLKEAFERLTETRIETNIRTNDIEQIHMFGLIDDIKIIKETREGRMLDVEVTLSEWVFNAIHGKEVLTLSRDYFRLRKPLERRLYELARKHCNDQPKWHIGLQKLHQRCGSSSTIREFRRLVGKIVADNEKYDHIPDYIFALESDLFIARPRPEFLALGKPDNNDLLYYALMLKGETTEQAKELAPGWDIYILEDEWRQWIAGKVEKGEKRPRDPDKSFLGFCRKRGSYR